MRMKLNKSLKVLNKAKDLSWPTAAVARDKRLAKSLDYSAASDFEYLMLEASMFRRGQHNLNNDAIAYYLECAAYTVRRYQKTTKLMTRKF